MESKKFFVGREDEVKRLNGLASLYQSDLVTILGRRRVGKTFLAKNAFKEPFTFHITGIKDADKETMLKIFVGKIQELSNTDFDIAVPDDWVDAFTLLKQFLNQKRSTKKKILFIDEFPWLDGHKSGFLRAFEFFWNDWAVDQNILVIICGSSTSWMIDNVLNNKAGLHNRITSYFHLSPFTLRETEQFLHKKQIKLPRYDIVLLYMAMGGIPYYLNEVQKRKSAIQNIDSLFFSSKSTLKNEFHNLYRALFDFYEKYELLVQTLSKKQKGLTRQEIIAATKFSNGGGLTRMLHELEECSFIKTYLPFGKEKKETLYRLVDEYSQFYFQFNPHKNIAGSFMALSQSPKFKAWAGFAFESVCMKHISEIKRALSIAGIFSTESSFYSKGTESEEGFQLDLLIDRNDNAINICEMKFYASEYELTKKEADKIRIKRELFRAKTKTKKHLMHTLITTYGVKQNEYSLGIIDHDLDIHTLFN
jgi:uncharacterized protein